ncbi:MAG TPA: GNAT family N-acetyltransferase [Streptosporangiaceae bacterium]
MRIAEFDPATDAGMVLACYRIYAAGKPADDPHGPLLALPFFTGWFQAGWAGHPRETVAACIGSGGVGGSGGSGDSGGWAGACLLELPGDTNAHLGELTILVAPGQRRRGLGAELLRHAAQRARDHGRTLLWGETRGGSAGSAFAAAMGARAELVEVRRVLELDGIPAGQLARLRGQAEAAASGYSLIRWTGPVPAEHLDQVVAVKAAMADAPRNPGEEELRTDAARIRRNEQHAAGQGMRRYSVAARCDRTGELAGLTQVDVDPGNLAWAFQLDTAVTRAHRGRRLGLLMKTAMLDWLARAEPGVRRIQTGNADSNRHMIAVNAALGYRILDTWQSWEIDVAAILAAPPASGNANS